MSRRLGTFQQPITEAQLRDATLLALLPTQQPNLGRHRTWGIPYSCQNANHACKATLLKATSLIESQLREFQRSAKLTI